MKEKKQIILNFKFEIERRKEQKCFLGENQKEWREGNA